MPITPENKVEVFVEPLEPDGYSDAASVVLRARVQGDEFDRVTITADGTMTVGDGTEEPSSLVVPPAEGVFVEVPDTPETFVADVDTGAVITGDDTVDAAAISDELDAHAAAINALLAVAIANGLMDAA